MSGSTANILAFPSLSSRLNLLVVAQNLDDVVIHHLPNKVRDELGVQKACKCGPRCGNRVAQHPRRIKIQIFKTEHRGWGVRTSVALIRGQVLGVYTGLLIRRQEASKLSGTRASFCFDLDINEAPDEDPPKNAYSVDASAFGASYAVCPTL
ncbi:hypothetical protein B0H13DRAFT_1855905 [Mycena leptocephala]|nr:hypothetical protein B0H13DRAFT_1855905 [Mycena leptocephala]